MNSLTLRDVAFGDLDRELDVTRTVLERLPEEKFGWKPHEKSMSLGKLAEHVAQLPGWIKLTLESDELDMAAPNPPAKIEGNTQLLDYFDRNVAAMREVIAKFDLEKLGSTWTMRNGEQVIVEKPRLTVYRVWCLNHLIHHRGQLCLYLRLLNIPVPTVYFNTADDPAWVFA